MPKLLNRYCEILARDGNEERTYNGLNFGLDGHRTNDLQPNELNLKIHNLNKDSRDWITREHLNIEIVAGYTEHHGQIFKGAVKFGSSVREGGDWITDLVLKDGDIAWRNIFINQSFAKGTPMDKVIEKLFNEITGLPKQLTDQFQKINQAAQGRKDIVPVLLFPKTKAQTKKKKNSKDPPPTPEQVKQRQQQLSSQRQKAANVKLERARITRGSAMDKLDLFCKSYGLHAVWDQQTLNILPADVALADNLPEIAVGSGLVGNVEPIIDTVQKNYESQQFLNGWSFRANINHEIQPGHLVWLDSINYVGALLIKRVEYKGQLRGGDWIQVTEGTPYEV